MSSQQLDEEAIFHVASQIPAAQGRSAYLDQVCAGDRALRERVEALLAVHEQEQEFLKSNPEPAPTIDQPAPTEAVGQQIGRYKLLQQIGEGGFGVVYMAEQHRPMRRKVAIKVIKPGMDTKEVIARFEAERQALAMMDHPNIAKVFDAGTTELERPYFVMELVRGIPITEYCDRERFGTPERLELFVKTCQAVQHAHQKGIIHRDIKPSNVLITEHDGAPVVKVIDFGVAKAINQQLTERTIYTRHQQMVGTPMYMSPEQAELSGLDVDTRSDIYSLGVLLYELLTGTTPFDKARLSEAAYDEIRRIIREEEPSKPSTKIRTLGKTVTSVSGYRRTDSKKLSQLLRGDLDWIVMKSLEKDRNRRYDTAKGLANDIERHLNDEPVVARPPSATYQFQKFARRNKTLLTSAVVVSVALVVGAGVATWTAIEANRARDLADTANNAAQINLVRAREAEATQKTLTRNEKAAREETRRLLYVSDMNVALQEWTEGNVERVVTLLKRHWPKEDEEDLRDFEWYHVWNLCRRPLVAPTLRHDEEVYSVAFAPDGKTLASASKTKVTVWDVRTGKPRTRILSDPNFVWSVAFSPDGKWLAAANYDNGVKLWNLETGLSEPEHNLESDDWSDVGSDVWSVAFAPDGDTLAATGGGDFVSLWDVASGAPLHKLVGHTGLTRALAFSSDGRFLATGTANPETAVRLWDAASLTELETFPMDGTAVSVVFSPDSKTMAVKSEGKATLWDVANGEQQPLSEEAAKSRGFGGIAFSPNGKVLAFDGPANTVKLWDMAIGEVDTITGHSGIVSSVAFSPNGDVLASGSLDRSVKLWDLTVAREQSTLRGHAVPVLAVSFSADGALMSSCGKDGVKLWETATWSLRDTVAESKFVHDVVFSPDSKWLAYYDTTNPFRPPNRLVGC